MMNLMNLVVGKNIRRSRRPRLHRQIAKKVNLTDPHLAAAVEAVVAVENEVPQVHQAPRLLLHHHQHHRILMLEKGEEAILLKDLKAYLQRDQDEGVNQNHVHKTDLNMKTIKMNN